MANLTEINGTLEIEQKFYQQNEPLIDHFIELTKNTSVFINDLGWMILAQHQNKLTINATSVDSASEPSAWFLTTGSEINDDGPKLKQELFELASQRTHGYIPVAFLDYVENNDAQSKLTHKVYTIYTEQNHLRFEKRAIDQLLFNQANLIKYGFITGYDLNDHDSLKDFKEALTTWFQSQSSRYQYNHNYLDLEAQLINKIKTDPAYAGGIDYEMCDPSVLARTIKMLLPKF